MLYCLFLCYSSVEAIGGKALPVIVDVRDEKQVQKAVDEAVKKVSGFYLCLLKAL